MIFKIVLPCLVLFKAQSSIEGQVILADRCKAGPSVDDDLVIKMKDIHMEVQQLRNKLQTTEDRLANDSLDIKMTELHLEVQQLCTKLQTTEDRLANDSLDIKMKDLNLEVQQLRNKLQTTEDRLAETETIISELRKYLYTCTKMIYQFGCCFYFLWFFNCDGG